MPDYELPEGDEILAVIEASGLRGRGGAAYPTAAKWRAARDTAATPLRGRQRRRGRSRLVRRPAAARGGSARGAGRDAGLRARDRRAPRHRLRARRVPARGRGHAASAIEEARAGACSPGSTCVVPRRRLLRVRRGDGAAALDRGPARRAAPEAALPRRARPVRPPDRGAERRDAGGRAVGRCARAGAAGTKAVCLSGAVATPGVVEIALGTPLRRVLDEARRRRARGPALEDGARRRPDGPRPARARVRHAALLRGAARARTRRHRRARRHGVRARAGRAPVRLRRAPSRAAAARRAASARRGSPHRPTERGARAAARDARDREPVRLRRRACRARSATCSSTSATRCSRDRARVDGDGIPVAARPGRVLDAAARPGADVPASLPRRPRSSRGGHCRACLVEVDGRCVAACTTPARDGVEVVHRHAAAARLPPRPRAS